MLKQKKLFDINEKRNHSPKIFISKGENLKNLGEDIERQLWNLFSKDKSKLSKQNNVFFLLHTKINIYLKQELTIFLKKDFQDAKNLFLELDLFLDKLINKYEEILNDIENNYDISKNEIKKNLNFITKILKLDTNKLKNILGIGKFNFNSIKNNSNIINTKNKDFLKELENAKKKQTYKINRDIFNEVTNIFLKLTVRDIKQIFGIIRFGDDDFSEGVHKFYGLESKYIYNSNIYYFAYALNNIYIKTFQGLNNNFNEVVKISNINISPEEISIITYMGLKKFLQKD